MKETYTGKQLWMVMKKRHEDDEETHDYRPTRKHSSKGQAEMEAMRLAILNRGHTFDVIRVDESVTALTVHVEHHSAPTRYI